MEVLGKNDTPTIETGVIAASGSYTSRAFLARDIEGDATMQWTVTGDGTVKIEVLTSLDGAIFNDIADDIATAQTKTSGVGGTNQAAFGIPLCDQVKFKFTETGGADEISVVARLRAR